MEIIPAIIAKDFEELERKIKLVESYVKSVQIDVMDGFFVSNITWNNPEKLKNIETGLKIEAHLMVEDVEGEVEKWINSGVKRILAHYEALASEKLKTKNEKPQRKIKNLFDKCQERGIELGLVLNLETPIDVLDEIIMNLSTGSGHNNNLLPEQVRLLADASKANIDVIQLMSIEKIGAHGYPFSEKVIPKIKALRQKYPGVKIEVDGGINIENAKELTEAGADALVAGSAIFGSKNIPEIFKKFKGIVGS